MKTKRSKKKNIGKIIEILIEEEAKKKARGGKPNKQCMFVNSTRIFAQIPYIFPYSAKLWNK
ncbi:hypothetical protein wTpre_102 [Wolbachia endosymbiont of Trichogramma pretiosum]|nr:hypothetical protein [Wolbachia endosymbiont of Trichogramma pretiosum]OCA05783.1 hypothetical protein wTpre_102 [Wolbachia endosymbiont of Trichogramma pretiosum]